MANRYQAVGVAAMGDKYGEIVRYERVVNGKRVQRERKSGSKRNLYRAVGTAQLWHSTESDAVRYAV